MKELRLDDFLHTARAAGVADSEGVFSISQAKAMQKMARYSLPYPEAWILKVVQAAVTWKASEIVVRQTRLYTTIEFCPAEKKNIPTEEEVVSTLLGDTQASAIPVGKLCLGLRTLVQLEDYSFILTLNTGRSEARPLYAGRDAQALPQMHRLRLARSESAGVKLVVIHLRDGENLVGRLVYRFVPWLRRDRQIANELAQNAGICNVPIRLNGRPLTDLLQSGVYGLNSETRPLLLSGVKSPREPLLQLAENSREALIPYYARPSEVSDRGESEFSAWYLCQAYRKAVLPGRNPGLEQTNHEIHWVCDGVVVQREAFLLPTYLLKLVVFLNAEGLQTDITGLLLKDSEEKIQRWMNHFQLLKTEWARLSTETSKFFPTSTAGEVRAEAPTVTKYLCEDFAGLSEAESPKLQRRSRPTPRRRHSRNFDHGLAWIQSGKYFSEVVKSEDGKSHLIIRTSTNSQE